MPAEPVIKSIGLWLGPNQADAPPGALLEASNVIQRYPGVLEPRPGVFRISSLVVDRLYPFGGTLVVFDGSGPAWKTSAGTSISGGPSSAGQAVVAAGNLYLASGYRLDAVANGFAVAGAPRAAGFDKDLRQFTSAFAQMSRTGTTVTVTTSATHNFYTGQQVQMTSAGEANFPNGTKTVTGTPTATSFTYTEAGAAATNASPQTFAAARLVGTGGWLADGYQAAYRFLIDAPDANNTEKLGAVSGRFIQANQSGEVGYSASTARNAVVRALLPSGATSSHWIRVYRSAQVPVGTEPSDELGQVWEAKLTSTDISRGYVDVTDIVTDSLRGPTIYTAPSQEGIAANNEKPPNARTLAFFGGSVHWADVTQFMQLEVTLLGVGGTGGLQNGQTLTIGGATYTCTTSTPTTALQVYLDTSGSAAQNIRNTALNLCAVINRDTSNALSAFYVSGPDDNPGRLLFLGKTPSSATSTISTSVNSTAFSPAWDSSLEEAGGAYFGNRVYHSKDGQPEAVPFLNYSELGTASNRLLAIVALRDSMIAFTNEGIFRGTGASGRFRWTLFDPDIIILAPRTAVAFQNAAVAWTDHGVVAISDGGVEELSGAIDPLLEAYAIQDYESYQDSGPFAVAVEYAQRYELYLCAAGAGVRYSNLTLVYNAATQAWTSLDVPAKDSCVWNEASVKPLRCLAQAAGITRESAFRGDEEPSAAVSSNLYYDDLAETVTINSVSGVNLTLASASGLQVGDVLSWSSGASPAVAATIEAINGNVVTMNSAQTLYSDRGSYPTGSVSVRRKYDCAVTWRPLSGGDDFSVKRFAGINFLFDMVALNTAAVFFATATDQGTAINASFEALPSGLYILKDAEEYQATQGALLFQYTDPGGNSTKQYWLSIGDAGGFRNARADVPQSKRLGARLTVRFVASQAGGFFRLSGLKVDFEDSSWRTPR